MSHQALVRATARGSSSSAQPKQQRRMGRPGQGIIEANRKTEICRHWLNGSCPFGAKCAFAHGAEELRRQHSDEMDRCRAAHKVTSPNMSSRQYPCLTWVATGSCPCESRCTFLHDPRLRESSDAWLNAGRDSPRFHLRDASASCWGSAGGDTSEGGGGGVRFNLDWSQTNARTSENGHQSVRQPQLASSSSGYHAADSSMPYDKSPADRVATSLWQSLTTTLEGERADKDEHNPRALRTNTNTQNIRNPYATATACSGISAAVYNDFDDIIYGNTPSSRYHHHRDHHDTLPSDNANVTSTDSSVPLRPPTCMESTTSTTLSSSLFTDKEITTWARVARGSCGGAGVGSGGSSKAASRGGEEHSGVSVGREGGRGEGTGRQAVDERAGLAAFGLLGIGSSTLETRQCSSHTDPSPSFQRPQTLTSQPTGTTDTIDTTTGGSAWNPAFYESPFHKTTTTSTHDQSFSASAKEPASLCPAFFDADAFDRRTGGAAGYESTSTSGVESGVKQEPTLFSSTVSHQIGTGVAAFMGMPWVRADYEEQQQQQQQQRVPSPPSCSSDTESARCSERVLKSANSNAVPQSFTDASSLLSIAWHPSLNHDARTTLDPSRKADENLKRFSTTITTPSMTMPQNDLNAELDWDMFPTLFRVAASGSASSLW